MLIGAHVSLAGGLAKAIERGVERDCRAIQIFNQSPRMWRPTTHSESDLQAFRQGLANSPIEAVVVHTVYLLNCASADRGIRAKSRDSLIHSLRFAAQIGASGVVVHPGSATSGEAAAAIARCGQTIREALAESEGCAVHLENTAGAGGTLGRSVAELASLLQAAGGGQRVGVCLDSCHLFASGYDIRTPAGMDALLGELDACIGIERVGSLHLNDSQAPLASNRDRHANIGEGQLGERGCASFLGAPQLQRLPCLLETNGSDRKGATRQEVDLALALHKRGLDARRRAGAGSQGAARPARSTRSAPAAGGRSSSARGGGKKRR